MKDQLKLFLWKSYFHYLKKKTGVVCWHATLTKPYDQFTTQEKIGIWRSHCQTLKDIKNGNFKTEGEIDWNELCGENKEKQ